MGEGTVQDVNIFIEVVLLPFSENGNVSVEVVRLLSY